MLISKFNIKGYMNKYYTRNVCKKPNISKYLKFKIHLEVNHI